MAWDILGWHHFHSRKRIHQKNESYPSPNKFKRVMDKLIYVAGASGSIMTIPQVLKIWVEKNALGVSLVSWTAYLVIAFFWLTYGILHKEKPIIFSNCLWIVLAFFVVLGTWIYG